MLVTLNKNSQAPNNQGLSDSCRHLLAVASAIVVLAGGCILLSSEAMSISHEHMEYAEAFGEGFDDYIEMQEVWEQAHEKCIREIQESCAVAGVAEVVNGVTFILVSKSGSSKAHPNEWYNRESA